VAGCCEYGDGSTELVSSCNVESVLQRQDESYTGTGMN
jgi:hypothetical protein